MASRTYHYIEELGPDYTTSGSYVDQAVLTFQPEASATYLILVSYTQGYGTTAELYQSRLFNDTDGAEVLLEIVNGVKDITDKICHGGIAVWTASSSPPEQTFSLEFHTNASESSDISNATITAIKLASGDEHAESEGESSTSSSTFQDKTTLSFTPGSSGDYLVIASAEMYVGGAAGHDSKIKLTDGTNDYGKPSAIQAILPGSINSERMAWLTMVRATLSGAQSWKIQFASASTTDNVYIRRARIYAIRLDTLDSNEYVEARSESTTTSTSFIDAATMTKTPAAQDYLMLAVGLTTIDSTSQSQLWKADRDATDWFSQQVSVESNSGSGNVHRTPHWWFKKQTETATSKDYRTRVASESGATVKYSEQAIALLQLTGTAGVAYDQEGFRWRYDDGDEDGATFSAAQDEHSAASIGITKRLRVIVDVTGNPGSPAAEQFQLQYRRTGSPTEEWKKVN